MSPKTAPIAWERFAGILRLRSVHLAPPSFNSSVPVGVTGSEQIGPTVVVDIADGDCAYTVKGWHQRCRVIEQRLCHGAGQQ
jgi:hypothetical protein